MSTRQDGQPVMVEACESARLEQCMILLKHGADENSKHAVWVSCFSFELVFSACMDEKAVRLSVRPFVKRVDYDETEERSVQIFIPIRKII